MKVRFLEVNKFAIVNVRWRSISMYMQRFIEIQFFLQNKIIKNTIYFRYFHKKGLLSQIGQENLNVTAPHFNIKWSKSYFSTSSFFRKTEVSFPCSINTFSSSAMFRSIISISFFQYWIYQIFMGKAIDLWTWWILAVQILSHFNLGLRTFFFHIIAWYYLCTNL